MNQLVESHTAQAGQVSPQDIETFYRQNPEQFRSPEQVRASHILVRSDTTETPQARSADRARADSLLAELKKGADFATVARQNSEDPGSAERGGDLDYFARGQMVPAFDNAAFSLDVGQLSGIVETPFGYHILKVTDKKSAGTVSLDEVRPRLEQYLQTRGKSEALRTWVMQLRSAAKVEVADSTGALVSAPPPSMAMPPATGQTP
jgi:peptidyl-prolyl cis-trans isomerase C